MSAAVRDSAGWTSSGATRPAGLRRRAWTALGLSVLIVQLVVSVAMWRQATLRQLPGDATDDAVLRVRLSQQPFDVAGHLAFGIARLNANDPSGARRALRAAAAIAPNEPQVLRTQAFTHFTFGETAAAIEAVVRLLDAEPEAARDAYAALGNVMSTPAMEAVVNRWADQRSVHLGGLADAVCTSNQALQVKLWLATRAAAAAALRPETLTCLFSQASRSPDAASVYALWLGSLPSTEGSIDHVWNGNFEQRERATPFDWKLGRGGEFRDGYSATIQLERSGGPTNRYLSVELNGRPVTSTIAETHLVLPPGPYTLSYRTRDRTAAGSVRLGFGVACHGSGQVIAPVTADARETTSQTWSTVRTSFVVPSGCHAQVIRVDGSPASWKAAGTKGRFDFDDVAITGL